MKRSIITYGVAFAAIGAVVAIALLAYDYLVLVSPSGTNTASDFDRFLFLALCPPSIALVALERAHGAELLFGLFDRPDDGRVVELVDPLRANELLAKADGRLTERHDVKLSRGLDDILEEVAQLEGKAATA